MRYILVNVISLCLLVVLHTNASCLDFPYLLPDDVISSSVDYTDDNNQIYEVPWPKWLSQDGLTRATEGDIWTKVLFAPSLKEPEYRKEVYANILLSIATMSVINESRVIALHEVLSEVDKELGTAFDVHEKIALAYEVLAESNLKYVKGTTQWNKLINKVKTAGRHKRLLTRGQNWKMANGILHTMKVGYTLGDIVTRATMINALARDANLEILLTMEDYFQQNPDFRLKDHDIFMGAFTLAKSQLSANQEWWNAFIEAAIQNRAEIELLVVDVLAYGATKLLTAHASKAAALKIGVAVSLWAVPVALGIKEYHEMVGVLSSIHQALLAGVICQELYAIPITFSNHLPEDELQEIRALDLSGRYAQYEFYYHMYESLTGWLANWAAAFFVDIRDAQNHYRNRLDNALTALISFGDMDTVPPTITDFAIEDQRGNKIVDGGMVSGTVTIVAQATDDQRIDVVVLIIDGTMIDQMTNTRGSIYEIEYNTFETGPGSIFIEVIATDTSGHWHSVGQNVYVDNSIHVTIGQFPDNVGVGETFTVSGMVTDASGSPLSNVDVSVKLGSVSICSGKADVNGKYLISCTAPGIGGVYSLKVEVSHNSIYGSAENTLTVSAPSNIDLAIGAGWSVKPTRFRAPEQIRVSNLRINNLGADYSIGGFLSYTIKQASTEEIVSSYSRPIVNIGSGGYWDVPDLDDNSFEVWSEDEEDEGLYYIEVYVDHHEDSDYGNNWDSRSIYNGSPPEREAYRVVSPIIGTEDLYGENESHVAHTLYGDYQIFVIRAYLDRRSEIPNPWAKFLVKKNGSEVTEFTLHREEYGNYQWRFIIHVTSILSDSQVEFECFELMDPADISLTVLPQHAYAVAGSRIEYQIMLPYADPPFHILPLEDRWNVRNWQWEHHHEGRDVWTWYADIPSDHQEIIEQSFWLVTPQYGGNNGYAKKLLVTVMATHDISVTNLSTPHGKEYEPGTIVPISVSVEAANGYPEHPKLSLSISGPNGYHYSDTETPTVSGTQTVTFSPEWDTTCLQSDEDYTITVTAYIPGDTNSGNNTQTATVYINELPSLVVNAQSDSIKCLQGDAIQIYATVTANGNSVTDSEVVAHIDRPDESQEDAVMTYNADKGRYEYTFTATQKESYSGNVTASKSGFSDGSDDFGTISVSNRLPQASITSVYPVEGDWISQNSVAITWSGTDAGTPISMLKFTWRLDGGEWQDYASDTSTELHQLSEGWHTFEVKAYDGELVSPTPASRTWGVDTIAPVVEITTSGGNDFSADASAVTIAGTTHDDPSGSGISSIFISSGEKNQGSSLGWSFTVNLSSGINVFTISAIDMAGNVSSDAISVEYTGNLPLLGEPGKPIHIDSSTPE